jgi:hypothetical protein
MVFDIKCHVNLPINFNNQSLFMTIKIRDIPMNGMLPSEFKTIQFSAFYGIPEFFLRLSHLFAQVLGKMKCMFLRTQMQQVLPRFPDKYHPVKIKKSDSSDLLTPLLLEEKG